MNSAIVIICRQSFLPRLILFSQQQQAYMHRTCWESVSWGALAEDIEEQPWFLVDDCL